MSLNELIPKELKVSTGSKFDGRHMYSKCLNCTQWWCCLITANVQSIVLPTFLRLLERRSSRSAPTQWRWRHFYLHLAQYILLLQLARTMVFFYLSHFTSKLAEACKSFLNSVRKEGIAEHSPQFLLREQITAIYALVELHEGSSMVMPLGLSSWMAEMTELDM